ncbi:MAG TPA: hypothetical protein VFW68_09800 [Rhodocyclaceae bacterium]|nr:hypothetical protein [Rhodocyclaceae bacterium]
MFPKEIKTIPATPIEAWQAGFNYAFGFQLKLMYGFFGLTSERKKDA